MPIKPLREQINKWPGGSPPKPRQFVHPHVHHHCHHYNRCTCGFCYDCGRYSWRPAYYWKWDGQWDQWRPLATMRCSHG